MQNLQFKFVNDVLLFNYFKGKFLERLENSNWMNTRRSQIRNRSAHNRFARYLIWVVLFAGVFTVESKAESYLLPDLASHETERTFTSGLEGHIVDPYIGNLKVIHQDIALKGNGGLDIVVNRVYDLNSLGSKDLYFPSYKWVGVGLGWSLNVAPKVVMSPREDLEGPYDDQMDKVCNHQGWSSVPIAATYVLEHMDGRREPLIPTGTDILVTGSNWKLTCGGTAQIHRLQSPDGLTYELGDKHYQAVTSWRRAKQGYPHTLLVLQATRIIDKNGNSLTIAYEAMGQDSYPYELGLKPRHAHLPTTITANDGRFISFHYDDNAPAQTYWNEGHAPRLVRIDGPNGAAWQYRHEKGDFYDHLVEVLRPDGTSWKYSYWPKELESADSIMSSYRLKTLSFPAGGVRSYEYEVSPTYKQCSTDVGYT